jgi:hypothetical protein
MIVEVRGDYYRIEPLTAENRGKVPIKEILDFIDNLIRNKEKKRSWQEMKDGAINGEILSAEEYNNLVNNVRYLYDRVEGLTAIVKKMVEKEGDDVKV